MLLLLVLRLSSVKALPLTGARRDATRHTHHNKSSTVGEMRWHRLPAIPACAAGLPARRNGRSGAKARNVAYPGNAPFHSAGQVAQRDGLVARSTPDAL